MLAGESVESESESNASAPWVAPGQLPPERISRWENEPDLQDPTNYWLPPQITSRVPYTDVELVAAHREATKFARKRLATESEAQAFADWCIARIPDGEIPEFWVLWKRFNVGPEAVAHEARGDRLEAVRLRIFRLACRMGLSAHAEDVAAGVVADFIEKGERPYRLAIIDYCREHGMSAPEDRGKTDPTSYRATPEKEESALRDLADDSEGSYREIRHDLREVLDALPRHDRMLLLLRFRWALSMREIGDLYGFSESRASQVLKRMLIRAKRTAKELKKQKALKALPLKVERRYYDEHKVEIEEKKRNVQPEPPPFEVVLEDSVPLGEPNRAKQRRPEIEFLLSNMKVGQSVVLPELLAKRFAAAVKKKPDWRLAQRKTDKPELVRVWRIQSKQSDEASS